MTTTDTDPSYRTPVGQISVTVSDLKDGGGEIHIAWASDSPWVPTGELLISTKDDSVVTLTSGQVAEGLIRQLRPILASMVATVWTPF